MCVWCGNNKPASLSTARIHRHCSECAVCVHGMPLLVMSSRVPCHGIVSLAAVFFFALSFWYIWRWWWAFVCPFVAFASTFGMYKQMPYDAYWNMCVCVSLCVHKCLFAWNHFLALFFGWLNWAHKPETRAKMVYTNASHAYVYAVYLAICRNVGLKTICLFTHFDCYFQHQHTNIPDPFSHQTHTGDTTALTYVRNAKRHQHHHSYIRERAMNITKIPVAIRKLTFNSMRNIYA